MPDPSSLRGRQRRGRLIPMREPPGPQSQSPPGRVSSLFRAWGTARQRRRWILWEGPDGATTMPRFFFHLEDGATFLDADGTDLPDLKAARDEAIRATGEMLREIPNAIHRDDPLRMWVTDQPRGEGTKLFTLTVAAEDG
jgi:hypothetical protein